MTLAPLRKGLSVVPALLLSALIAMVTVWLYALLGKLGLDLHLAFYTTCAAVLLAEFAILGKRLWLVQPVLRRLGVTLAVLLGTGAGFIAGFGILVMAFMKSFR
jgi:hypothetical protein